MSAYQHRDGPILVPVASPPSWSVSYFYVVNDLEELSDPFDALRCLRLDEWEVRRATKRINLPSSVEFGVFVAVCGALDTPSGYVIPWDIKIGSETYASLHPPPWVTLASELGDVSVVRAVELANAATRAAERELRVRQTERALLSAKLLEHIRTGVNRRMVVTWFEGDAIWKVSKFTSGQQLHDALMNDAAQGRPHLIHFPDGWFVNGIPRLM